LYGALDILLVVLLNEQAEIQAFKYQHIMKPSSELFNLIRSLTKSEKRFFKLSSSLQTGDKNYLKIFDAIDKQKEYDEESLKGLFAKETFVKHFPSEKNHLYKLILKSLRSYHADNSVSGILKQETKNIEILYKKALYKECNKFLHRAKRIAIQNERFYYWFELLSWEKMLLEEAYEAGEFTKDLDALIAEEGEVLEKLRNLAAYHVLYSKINYVFRSGGYVRSEEEHKMVEEISEHPLIKGKDTALSHRAATICYYTQGFCSAAKRDFKTSYDKFIRVMGIMDSNPLIKKDLPKRYTRTLSSIISCLIDMERYEESRDYIEMLRALPKQKGFQSFDLQVKIFSATSLAELRLLDRTGQHELALEKAEVVLKEMEALSENIHKEEEIEFYYSLACIYFGAGMVNKSLFWLNKVLNDNENTLRQDIYSYARLFNLVIHYELGNFDLLEYIIKSTHRYLNKRQRAYKVEMVLLEHIKKLAKTTNEQTKKEILTSLKKELKELFKDQNESVVLKYFDFNSWIESRLTDIPFSEVVKEKIKKTAK